MEQDSAYLNQKVISKLGASVRSAGVDMTVGSVEAPVPGAKTDLETVNEKLAGSTGPVLAALSQVAQKGEVSSKTHSLPLLPLLPIGNCTVKSEPITTVTGAERTKVTLTPPGSESPIEYWSPAFAPTDHTASTAVQRAVAQRGRLLTDQEKEFAQYRNLIPENARIVENFQSEISDGPCFRPAR